MYIKLQQVFQEKNGLGIFEEFAGFGKLLTGAHGSALIPPDCCIIWFMVGFCWVAWVAAANGFTGAAANRTIKNVSNNYTRWNPNLVHGDRERLKSVSSLNQ
jgi:hypothetical protein